jgi:hypothetical protein
MKARHQTGRLVAVALVLLGGCGSDPRIPIGGNVTFDGQLVMDGSIVMEPADGQGQSTGGKILEGRYDLTGEAAPLPGKKSVRIIATRKTGRKVTPGLASAGTMVDEIERYIPAIYNRQTTLVCEVSKDGTRQIDFNLKSK